MALSIYLSIPSDFSTTNTLRILSIIQSSLYLATLFFILATFTLLSMLFRFADAISRLDGHPSRGSVAEEFLASKATQYGVRPSSTSTVPPRRLRELNYFTTISKLVPRILTLTLAGLVAAGLQLADRLLDRDTLEANIGMSVGSGVCEVLWIGGVTHLFYGEFQIRTLSTEVLEPLDVHATIHAMLPSSTNTQACANLVSKFNVPQPRTTTTQPPAPTSLHRRRATTSCMRARITRRPLRHRARSRPPSLTLQPPPHSLPPPKPPSAMKFILVAGFSSTIVVVA